MTSQLVVFGLGQNWIEDLRGQSTFDTKKTFLTSQFIKIEALVLEC